MVAEDVPVERSAPAFLIFWSIAIEYPIHLLQRGYPLDNRSIVLASAIGVAMSLLVAGCSPTEHNTEVTLPNGVTCKSETTGTWWSESHNLSCVDSSGKVIGSYHGD
jgi:hypothetical protein